MWTVFVAVVALLVGWATPQPAVVKKYTDALVSKIKERFDK